MDVAEPRPPVAAGRYRERLWPSAALWATVPIAAVSVGVVLAPISPVSAWLGAAVTAVLVAAGMMLGAARIEVSDGQLRAGRATIDVDLLGEPVGYTGPDATWQRGPGADARAYLLLRGWIGPVLRVPVLDPDDPTPYWLLSTRRPQELARCLQTARP